MRLVPKQLLRAGMTGQVPYYGGRMSPAQAYAASHPAWSPAPAALVPPPADPASGPSARPEQAPAPKQGSNDSLSALQHLLDTGVLTQSEYDDLRSRVAE
jgi:hypothetical protein